MSRIGLRAVLAATGSCLPKRVVRNDEFPASLQTSDEWISSRTGIRERRIAGDDETTSALGLTAARRALEAANLKAEDIDLIDMPPPSRPTFWCHRFRAEFRRAWGAGRFQHSI